MNDQNHYVGTQAPKPLFESLVYEANTNRRLTAAIRGSSYGDTFRTCQWLTLQAVCSKLLGRQLYDIDTCRAIALAAFVDTKHERMLGGYDKDHLEDGANYMDALASLMSQIEKRQIQ